MTAFAQLDPLMLAMGMTRPGARASEPALEAEVIEGCRKGDRGALDRVFRAHAEVLERLLVRLVGPGGDAEDLLQETFVAAIQAFPQFRGEASVRSWLHRIAINVAHKELRRPRRRREAPGDAIEMTASAALVPAEQLATDRLAIALYRHLDKLDAKKRIAIVLHVVEGYSVAEIAALTGVSQTATKSRLFWARRALLASLRRDPDFAEVAP